MSQRIHTIVGLALLVAGVATTPLPAESPEVPAWNVDPNHSEIGFSVHHFFTPVTGTFDAFEATLRYDPENPEASRVTAKIPVASINTRNERRDSHLKSPDFFAAEAHPHIIFESEGVKASSPGRLAVTGTLTIKDRSQRVILPVEVLGIKELPEAMQERMGAAKVASFRATLTVDRADFGVGVGNWASDAVVGEQVEIQILIEASH
jgi:polyisoprenoid-binding protein YceI